MTMKRIITSLRFDLAFQVRATPPRLDVDFTDVDEAGHETPARTSILDDDARALAERYLLASAGPVQTAGLLDDVKAIQADVLDRRALEVLPYLRSLNLEPSAAELKELDDDRKDVSEKERRKKAEADAKDLAAASEARDRLLSWDGRMTVDSAEAVLFACFYQRLIDEVFRDQYPETRWAPADHSRPKNDLWYLLRDEENVATRSSPARSARAMDSPRKSSART